MKNYSRSILATLLLLLAGTINVQASIIAMGDFTADTDTGLDWLDHSFTLGMSFDQVTVELGAGGLFDGWSVATQDQVHTYLSNAGWIGPFDPTNTSNVGFVSAFEALTTDSFVNDPASGIGILGLYDDFAGDLGADRLTDDPISGFSEYLFITSIDPSMADQSTSTFLVRATVIPVPSAFWLFSSGLLFLIGKAFRNSS
jgi:hypothetical protein